MLIFVTGPSAAGKTTLINHYIDFSGNIRIRAVTTRPRISSNLGALTISRSKFRQLQDCNSLCLISKHYEHYYAYKVEDIDSSLYNTIVIEVDSATAINNHTRMNAIILRVLPVDLTKALNIIERKREKVSIRSHDLFYQMNKNFLKFRQDKGDYIFVNKYDKSSLDSFSELITHIVNVNKNYNTE